MLDDGDHDRYVDPVTRLMRGEVWIHIKVAPGSPGESETELTIPLLPS